MTLEHCLLMGQLADIAERRFQSQASVAVVIPFLCRFLHQMGAGMKQFIENVLAAAGFLVLMYTLLSLPGY